MLLRLTSPDIRDTSLVDCTTGEVLYRTSTPVAGPSRSRAGSITAPGRASTSRRAPSKNSQNATPSVHDGAARRRREVAAEIVWDGRVASVIKIGDEVLRGTTELFDAAFVRVMPDETFLPTRMEYTWKIRPESLAVHRTLYSDSTLVKSRPVASLQPVTFLLVTTLRERLYAVTKYVYSQRKTSFSNLRVHASRSLANIRDRLRRTIAPAASNH
ncbi:uncharacterized protein BXZ73DRAFT_90577 [Epithele typhae]|uniref:uncharacterized protein n=1 Tax=Epithele typhae TaxID=378194 RepID=UPI0020084263|nr:uncharacterized protein BXZ73DRAFT_90577 [Epithele typhae]KAH9928517.1 hypothetical protein BXZ73DRAFT_90577 [Epithele typhae]